MSLNVTGTIPPGTCYPSELQELAQLFAQILTAPTGGIGTVKSIYVQTSQPTGVPEGTLWYNPDPAVKQLKIYSTLIGSGSPAWNDQKIPDNSITTAMLQDGSVTRQKLAADINAILDALGAASGTIVLNLEEQTARGGSCRANFYAMSDGTLRVCGSSATYTAGPTANYFGKNGIGNNGVDSSYLPKRCGFSPPLESDNIVKVFTAQSMTVALSASGVVYTTGRNTNGQLGVGDTTNRFVFTKIDQSYFGDDPVKSISLGSGTSINCSVYAVTTTGKLYVWGHNYYGQLGLAGPVTGNTNQPSTPTYIAGLGTTVKDVVSAGAGDVNTTTDVKVSAWVLLNDGTVMACGYNAGGQLGIGGTTSVSTFTAVPGLTGISKIVACGEAGTATAFFIPAAGSLYSVGYNARGQMGVGSATVSFDTVQEVTALSANTVLDVLAFDGSQYTSVFALIDDGTIRSWGYNGSGQLGLGSGAGTGNQTSPATPDIEDVTSIIIGGNTQKVCAALLQKTPSFDAGAPTYYIYGAGANANGILGVGDKVDRNEFTRVLVDSTEVSQIGFGSNNDVSSVTNTAAFLIRMKNGTVMACGFDNPNYGQLGVDANPISITVPAFVNF